MATGSRMRPAILVAGLLLGLLAVTLQGVQGEELEKVPSEDQCRPYIEKALKDLGTEGSHEHEQTAADGGQSAEKDDDDGPGEESAADVNDDDDKSGSREKREVSAEDQEGGDADADDDSKADDDGDEGSENEADQDQVETVEITSAEADDDGSVQVVEGDAEEAADSKEDDDKTTEADDGEGSQEQEGEEQTEGDGDDGDSGEAKSDDEGVAEEVEGSDEQKEEEEDVASAQDDNDTNEIDEEHDKDDDSTDNVESDEQKAEEGDDKSGEESEGKSGEETEEKSGDDEEQGKSAEEESDAAASTEDADGADSKEDAEQQGESVEEEAADDQKEDSKEAGDDSKSEESKQEEEGGDDDDKKSVEEEEIVAERDSSSVEQEPETAEASEEAKEGEDDGKSDEAEKEEGGDGDSKETDAEKSGEGEGEGEGDSEAEGDAKGDGDSGEDEESEDSRPEEEELIMEIEIPEVLRPRDHINQLLKLDEENEEKEKAVEKVADVVLRDLKRLYDSAIKPLETLYKYRDLSNRHFGDPEIFSKPLVLFMGPWSGGKSSIINYLLDIEYKPTSLRTGAEPSPAYFNILMHGEEEEVLDGTQLAADWTFSGLQKFGQGLLDRLKGVKLKSKLLEKVNIVEIPGILEIRKQVQRLFPFNDACQWFIDRADIIFLVYDPSKLDVGPETEAILDQLKGREYQTRIILNKADQVKPEELMRVQGALIWNISPLMSSAEPPIMYSASLWSIPYEAGAPTRLLYAQERAFLRDLRSAVDKRVEHKIASARRFAVRVRNHAKMVDCYLTTYYNHKSFFAKKKETADRIIENPQDYHIYEGLSTLTNISRYDLPDPDVYRDFFRLNALYEFPLLSTTCTYFRGCPINRLDVAIAYDLPELVGKYRKSVEAVLHQEEEATAAAAQPAATPAPAAAQQQQQKPAARSGASRISLS